MKRIVLSEADEAAIRDMLEAAVQLIREVLAADNIGQDQLSKAALAGAVLNDAAVELLGYPDGGPTRRGFALTASCSGRAKVEVVDADISKYCVPLKRRP